MAVPPPRITETVLVTAWAEFKFSAGLITAASAIALTLTIKVDGT